MESDTETVVAEHEPPPGETAAPDPPAAPPDMEDTIRESLAAIKARGSDDEAAETAPETVAPQGEPTDLTRDDKGRFVKQAKVTEGKPPAKEADAPAEPVAEASKNPDNLEQVDREGRRAPVDITQPPQSWRQEAKAAFTALPENVRREVHRRENDFHKGLAESREWADVGRTLDKEIRPYEAVIRAQGLHAEQVIGTLLNNAYVFRTGSPEEKADLLLNIVEQYGITSEQVKAAQERRGSGRPAVDPNLAALRTELGEVKQALTAREKAADEAQLRTDVSEARRFMADPKNEFASQVADQMAQLLTTGGADSYQDAYDKACRLHPAVSEKLIARRLDAERKRQAEEAAKARKAASANVTRRGTPPDVAPKGTIEDTARAALNRIRARGGGD